MDLTIMSMKLMLLATCCHHHTTIKCCRCPWHGCFEPYKPARHPLIVQAERSTSKQTNKQKFKVRQPQRAARSKRPNTPSDGSKNNGIHTTKQEEYPSRHPTTDTANKSPAGD